MENIGYIIGYALALGLKAVLIGLGIGAIGGIILFIISHFTGLK